MRHKVSVLVMLFIATALTALTALANHHAFSAYFDTQRPVRVTGTIVKVDWVNPAVFVHLRAADGASGQSTTWAFEGESSNSMARYLSPSMLKAGDTVTVVGWMGIPGTNLSETVADPELAARVRAERAASIAQFEFADGRKVPIVTNVPDIQ